MHSIFSQLKTADIETVCMSPNMMATYFTHEETPTIIRHCIEHLPELQSSGLMDTYIDTLREVCKDENIPLCDCYGMWKTFEKNGADVTRLLSNRINHPTEEMLWFFAYRLFDTIMNLK